MLSYGADAVGPPSKPSSPPRPVTAPMATSPQPANPSTAPADFSATMPMDDSHRTALEAAISKNGTERMAPVSVPPPSRRQVPSVAPAEAYDQEATVYESLRSAPPGATPTTRPPPPPFPTFSDIESGDDDEMTRMEQVPPEVLAELMSRAKAGEELPGTPSAPPASPQGFRTPRPSAGPFTDPAARGARPTDDDEPTRMGYDAAELGAQAALKNATQLGVPAIAAARPAPLPAAGDRRNMATQLGVPPQQSIPQPPRPLSSAPPGTPIGAIKPIKAVSSAPRPLSAPPDPHRGNSGTLFGLQAPAQEALAAAASSAPPPPPQRPAPPAAAPGPSIVPVQSAPPAPLQPGQPAPRRVPNAAPTLLGGVLAAALQKEQPAAAETPPPQASPFGGPPPHQGAPWAPPPGHPLHQPAQQPNLFAPAPGAAPPFAANQGAPPFGANPAGANPAGAPQLFAGSAPIDVPPMQPAVTAKKSGVPLVLVLLLLGGIVAGGGFFALRWQQGRTSTPVTASIDAAGNDLELTCATCTDGTKVSLGGTFTGHKARVILPAPLEPGDQILDAVFQAPNEAARSVKIPIAVEFRVDVDASTLHAFPPVLTLKPKVRPGGTLTVAGKPAPSGTAIVIPVGDAASGAHESVVKIPLDVAYHYERAGIAPRDGALHEELNILPLRLFSPKDGVLTADATVAFQGQAPPGITVHVGDSVIEPDDKGIFQVTRPLVVGANEIPLWLGRPETGFGGVSRGLTLHVTRSASAASLWTEAKAQLDKEGAGDLNVFYTSPASVVGKRFAFAGAIVDAQSQRGETIALVDGSATAANLQPGDPLACKAASCLVRVVASGTQRFAKGEKVRGIGRAVTPRDPKTPEVEAQLLVPESR